MSMHLVETQPIPRSQYLRVAVDYVEAQKARQEAESPRAIELRDSISALTDELKEKGLRVDDAGIAASPRAREIREELDKLVAEFQKMAEAAAKDGAFRKRILQRVKDTEGQAIVDVPVGEALLLLGLADLA